MQLLTFTKGLRTGKVKHNISTVRYDKIVYVRSLRHWEKGVNRMSNRVKNVSYMYRNALGKFVITKSNSKRIEDTVRRCEDIMIYMDVDAEMKMFLCHVEKRDDVYRLLAKEHFFGGETNANAPAYSAEFSLREANLCIADVTSWAKAVANA